MKQRINKIPFHSTNSNIIEHKLESGLLDIENSDMPFYLKSAKQEALISVYKMGVSYLHNGIRLNWVLRFLSKKQQFIFAAVSEKDLSEIVGITVNSEKYYTPEEEIILITLASQMGTVNKKTQEHYIELCRNYMIV